MAKSRNNYLSQRDIATIGGKLFDDEIFVPVKGESAIWVSNYARLISKRKGSPRLLKTVFQGGYQRVTLPQVMYGKKVKHMYYLHVLVARAFCKIPEWINELDEVEVHHIHKIDRENDIPDINYVTNLQYVPRVLHKAIDTIDEIWTRKNGHWIYRNYVQAAGDYGLTPYEFLALVGNEKKCPAIKTHGQYQYYKLSINHEGEVIDIDCRIRRNVYKTEK